MQNESAFPLNTTPKLTRRQILTWSSALLGVAATNQVKTRAFGQTPAKPASARNRMLVRPSEIPELKTRNKMVLELEGKMLVNEPDAKSKQKNRDAAVKSGPAAMLIHHTRSSPRA